MKSIQKALMVGLLAETGPYTIDGAAIARQVQYKKPVKECKNKYCGNLHDHNNSFCSAQCCHEYAASKD